MTEHRAVPTATAAPDADLVVAARTGDQHAFAAIYDRYADRVFSLCVTLTRDRGIAEDAMADTFLVAWQRLDQLRDPDRLRAWLFAIARNRVTRLGARAGRETPTDTMADGIDPATTTATDAVAETVVERVDADADAAVVWEAASALNPNERALLELSVRQGLDGLDLAAALGMTRHHVNVVAGRMRTNLEQGVAALDLLRREPGRCPALDDLVAGFDGVFTPAWRKRIARHARSCPTCGDQRSRTPVAAFGAVPLLLAPVSARAEILDSLPTSATGAPVVDHSSFRADRHGFPARPTRRAPLLVVVGALVVLVVGWPLLPADDADSSLATPLTSDATSTAAPPSDPSTAPPTTAPAPTTVPPTTAAPTPGECLVGNWVITQDEMNAFYDTLEATVGALMRHLALQVGHDRMLRPPAPADESRTGKTRAGGIPLCDTDHSPQHHCITLRFRPVQRSRTVVPRSRSHPSTSAAACDR